MRTPSPDASCSSDTTPAAAFARKPEYPLEFVYLNRQNFLHLQELVPQLIIISPGKPEDVRNEICRHVSRSWDLKPASTQGNTEEALVIPVVRRQTSCSVQNDPTTSL